MVAAGSKWKYSKELYSVIHSGLFCIKPLCLTVSIHQPKTTEANDVNTAHITALPETAGESERRKLSVKTWWRLNKMSAIRKKNVILLQQCRNTFNKSIMCLIWVSGMYNVPWVCFHMHVGVILSRLKREGSTAAEKPFGTCDGNDRNWKQITSMSGPSSLFKASRHRNGYFFVDVASGVLQQRGVIDLFIQYHSTWCLEL